MKMHGKTTALLASAGPLAVAGLTAIIAAEKPVGTAPPAAPQAAPSAAAGSTGDKKAMVPVNLALGKPATASSHQNDGLTPRLATDGDAGTRWCAENGEFPQWLQVDLGRAEEIAGCRLAWEFGDAAYAYKVEGSADGKAWNTLADRTAKPVANLPDGDAFAAKNVRHVKVTVVGGRPGAWASIKELEVFGTQKVPADSQPKPAGGGVAKGGQPAGGQKPDDKKTDAAPTPGSVKAPPGWDVTIFAAPPQTNYPTTVCARPDGNVFVGIDEMGSLGREKGRGRVDRLRDTDGDGRADQTVTVARMDYPRGVWADGRDLYVLHPPFLTKYTDDTGDGVADRSDVLVKGVSTESTLAARGPDHTTNGFRVGPDGWAYIAVGDFGALKAVGKDGAELQMYGGGVARVRLDGSGLEMYSFGQRNIYDVAVDPFGNCFTRDNTNDGGGWNVRLSHVVPTGNYGYPRLFVRFGDEVVQPLNDYGGGSPCGTLWVDEPNLPDAVHGLLTVEWGANKVFRHPLTARGAGYEPGTKQEAFLDLQRPTDIDYDGRGNFYVTSWANGSFNYSGPNVGYVAKVSPAGAKPEWPFEFPNVRNWSQRDLFRGLTSPSMKVRELAQCELIDRRQNSPAVADELAKLAREGPVGGGAHGPAVRALAVFTLRQMFAGEANERLARLAAGADAGVREVALRVLADRVDDKTIPLQPFLGGLKDKNPRVRLVAAWGAGRLGRPEVAAAVLPLAGDDDPLVQHVAVNALVALNAADVCLAAVDGTNAKVVSGALRALQQMHDPKVVGGLAAKLGSASLDAAARSAAYRALCRLHYKEAEWKGDWWGTRPDTSGPYYKTAEWAGTPAVREIVEGALKAEKPEIVRQLVIDMQRHKITSPAVQAFVADQAKNDPAFRDMLLDQLAGGSRDAKLTPDQIALLKGVAVDVKAEPAQRAKAIRAMAKDVGDKAALDATVDALAAVAATEKPAKELSDLLDESIRDAKYAGQVAYFAKLAESAEQPAKRELGYAVLVSIANSRLTKPAEKEKAAKAIEAGWEQPKTAASLLRAVGRTKTGEYRDVVEAMAADPNADVVRAAAYAAERLGMKGAGVAAESREMIEKVGYEKALELAQKEKGDAGQGKEIFARVGCVGCHTVAANEPPKGPYLGGIAERYNRGELAESILKPGAKIAQGFETQWFRLKGQEDDPIEGFVTREGGDDLELRNAAGVSQTIQQADVARRGKREISVMPEGLVNRLSPQELAHLLAYMESLKK